MTRWWKPTKNKRNRNRNPRYRLNESIRDEYGRGTPGASSYDEEEGLDWSNREGGYDDPAYWAEASASELKELKTQGYRDAMNGQPPAMPDDENYMMGFQDGQRDASLERQGHGAPSSAPIYESKWKDFIK